MKIPLIYIVDDELNIRELIKAYLEKENYNVKVFENPITLLEKFKQVPSDIIILDIMMPEMDGYTLCKEIRKISNVPLIIVSARNEELDRILGLELGGDDYIAKPFSPRELVIRVKNLLKRVHNFESDENKNHILSCNDIKIFIKGKKVMKDDLPITLTKKEYDTLEYLVKNKNVVLSRDQLINAIWGYDYIGDTRPVDDIVKRLRKKLKNVSSTLSITTSWGYGYKISEEK